VTLPRIQPIAPTWRKEPFDDPDWLFEMKSDGYRGLCYIEPRRNRLISRNNNIMTRFDALAAQVAAALYTDPRPFAADHFRPLIAHAADNGFPSDHSAAAAFIAVATLFVDAPLGIVACVVTVALGISRLYCLLHSPVDVLGGWLIGAMPAVVAGLSYLRGRLRSTVKVDRSISS